MKTLYLDHSATAPLRDEALEVMLPFLRERFGNPSSPHRDGRMARHAIEDAREQVAALLGAEARDIVFTSGATEANVLALWGAAEGHSLERIAVSAVEHDSVLLAARAYASRPARSLTVLPVDAEGRVPMEAVRDALESSAGLVSVMMGNNETGVLQQVTEIAQHCHARGVLYHCDAVQAAGRIPLAHLANTCDLVTLSAHKIGGPKGVGALYVRHGLKLAPQLPGPHEHGRRAGTEHVGGIAGFGKACELAVRELDTAPARLRELSGALEEKLMSRVPGAWINGLGAERLPHIVNAGVEGVDAEHLALALDEAGVAVSAGAACSSGNAQVSHVLLAMGQTHARAQSGVRFSVGANTTIADIERAAELVAGTISRMRAESSTMQSSA